MAMNRETKRMLQRQGQLDRGRRARRGTSAAAAHAAPEPRRSSAPTAREFVQEVRAELRKVAWPTKSETINYSIIVFIAVVVLTAFVGVLDYVFGEFVLNSVQRQ